MRVKTLTTSAILLSTALAMPVSAADLTVSVEKIERFKGTIMLALYDSEGSFQKTALAMANRAAEQAQMQFSFSDLAPGEYAVMAFHDVNDNKKLDANLLGIPKEPWGGSLQGKTLFGAPKWSDAKFELSEQNLQISVKLR